MHINSPVTLLSVPASRSSKTGRAVAISGRRTSSPARTSNASRSRGRSNARKCNARSPSSSNGRSIRCVEPAGNASPQRTNSLFCNSHIGRVPEDQCLLLLLLLVLVLVLLLVLVIDLPAEIRSHRDAPLATRLDQKLGTQRGRRDRRPSRFAESNTWMILQREKQPQECVA